MNRIGSDPIESELNRLQLPARIATNKKLIIELLHRGRIAVMQIYISQLDEMEIALSESIISVAIVRL